MIIGDKGLGKSVENGPTTIGQDGVIQQGTPSGPPHEGSRETYEGKIISVPRDYCWTPIGSGKILIGYKIWAWQREATNLANSVTQTSLRSHVKGSIIKHCYGDEAGKLGGFTSHTHNSWCTPKTWSETVTFEGRNAVRDSDEWWMNRFNTWGVLDYKTGAPQPENRSTVDGVDAKLWLAQAQEKEIVPTERPGFEESNDARFPNLPEYQRGTALPGSPNYGTPSPEYEGPGSAANDDQPPNPQPPVDPGKPEPFAGRATPLIPDPTTSPSLALKRKNSTVTQKRRIPCNVGPKGTLTCPEGEQGHHIVPEYTLKYDSNNRIANMPSYDQGAAICLAGYGGETEHGITQSKTKLAVGLLGQVPDQQFGKYRYPKGTAPIGEIQEQAIQQAISVAEDCETEIRREVAKAFANTPYDQLGRTTWSPSTGDALTALQGGSMNNGVKLWPKD